MISPEKKSDDGLRIVITGGVTGGHLFPGVALAEEFLSRDPRNQVRFMSIGNALERNVLGRKGFDLAPVEAIGIKGKGIFNLVRSISKLPGGLWRSIQLLREFDPHIVVCVGSFAAGPATFGAWLLRKKIVLCEQNILPGITNRILSRFADRIYVSFEDTGQKFDPTKVRYFGNPIRSEMLAGLKEKTGSSAPAAGPGPFTILIAGGSQGAHSINMSVIEALSLMENKEHYRFVHQTGRQDENMVRHAYELYGGNALVQAFFDDMAQQYDQADLVICRSGATTVAELTAMGKPAIFIPFPHAADNHQFLNARSLVMAGAADMISEPDLTGKLLAEKITHYATNREVLADVAQKARLFGHPEASGRIVNDCYELLKGGPGFFSMLFDAVIHF